MVDGGVDYSFDCTGDPSIIYSALECCNMVHTYIYVYSFHTHHQHTKHINIFLSLLIELNQVLVKPIMVPKTKQNKNQLTNLNFNFPKNTFQPFFIMLNFFLKLLKPHAWNAKNMRFFKTRCMEC